ncbi:hypothetical protein EDC01DRAFT_245815 [Geopyxis carbonaria]|nr:hypothetical protein EDC01DRAFT_245815 [Geopyxis carbonaria]
MCKRTWLSILFCLSMYSIRMILPPEKSWFENFVMMMSFITHMVMHGMVFIVPMRRIPVMRRRSYIDDLVVRRHACQSIVTSYKIS